jgi:glycosyltransferase involved in cell wall biosynthesis
MSDILPVTSSAPLPALAKDAAPQHLLPQGGTLDAVELSIVIPALNEEITVGEFVDWCVEGLARAQVRGQVLIVDSSTDRTPDIALARGAEVLRVPKRGLGRAYIDAIPYIRGKYVLLGDADLTYDFREFRPFLEKFREGFEYIMGSRFKGEIEKDAMPPLHRYFGTPVTTWMLNFIYGSHFSDIHCGMRGVTRTAFLRMRMRSQSWQYASEMIIKSLHLRLKTAEVPIVFHKDREGRVSNLKRGGWFGPWYAGWITLQALCTYGADFFLFRPGLILFALGTVGVAALFNGPVHVGGIGLSLHWMLLFLLCSMVGLQLVFTGLLAKTLYDPEKQRSPRWLKYFGFTRSAVISSGLFLLGIASAAGLLMEYFQGRFRLPSGLTPESYRAVAGVGLILAAVVYFTFGLVLNALHEATLPEPLSSDKGPGPSA